MARRYGVEDGTYIVSDKKELVIRFRSFGSLAKVTGIINRSAEYDKAKPIVAANASLAGIK